MTRKLYGRKRPNYLEKVLALGYSVIAQGGQGKVHHITVAHDDWCAIWLGGSCDCNPDVSLSQPQAHEEVRL